VEPSELSGEERDIRKVSFTGKEVGGKEKGLFVSPRGEKRREGEQPEKGNLDHVVHKKEKGIH